MSEILCVTNRTLCLEPFPERVKRIAAAKPKGIILREKDLSGEAYAALAQEVMEICRTYGVCCILHSRIDVALELRAEAIHLPLPLLRAASEEQKARFRILGASCHSVAEALEAQELGCTYLTAGHVFATDCKREIPGRGLAFLTQVCSAVSIPVYAIGGISANNAADVRRAGARGACLMSSLMTCGDVSKLLASMEG